MTKRQTILVAGGDMLYVELMERFDRQSCLVTYCATQGQVLDRAADASLVIVNLDIAGGAEDLCQRLRNEASSAKLPIIVVAPAGLPRYPNIDEQVDDNNLDQLIEVIDKLLPQRRPAPRATAGGDEEGLFDVETHTGIWRKDEASGSWPPPPPEPSGDMMSFTREFAGYVNSLNEAFTFLGELSPDEISRLEERGDAVIDRMDEVLALTQNAVNEALKRGELTTMREMSNARNVIYEKLRQLRNALRQHREGGPPDTPEETEDAAVRSATSTLSAVEARPVESELTRAARAREVSRRQEAKARSKAERPRPARGTRRRRITGTAKKAGEKGRLPGVIFIALPILIIGGLVAYLVLQPPRGGGSSKGPRNHPPAMQSVQLQQASDGVRVRVSAIDAEGDTISYIFRWRVNGKPAGGPAPLLPTTAFKRGDSVQAEVTAADTIARGTPMLSQPLKIP